MSALFWSYRSGHNSQSQLTLEFLTAARVVDLKKGEADLVVRSGPIPDEDLIACSLGESGWSLYASHAYLARHSAPPDPDDLSGHEIIGYDLTLFEVPAAKWVEQGLPRATLALRSREMTDMLAAARSGAGLAVLPCLVADDESTLVRVTPKVLETRQLHFVYAREARQAQPVQAVIRFVVDVIRENSIRIAGSRSRDH